MSEPLDVPEAVETGSGLKPVPALVCLGFMSAGFVLIWSLRLGVYPQDLAPDVSFLVASLVLAAALLTLSYIDLRTYLILDVLTLPLIAGGLVWNALQGNLVVSVSGAIAGYLLIRGLSLLWQRRTGSEGIGQGDAKLLSAGGAWLGFFGIPLILFVSAGLGLAFILAVAFLIRSKNEMNFVSFGPFLSFGIWAGWCWPLWLI